MGAALRRLSEETSATSVSILTHGMTQTACQEISEGRAQHVVWTKPALP